MFELSVSLLIALVIGCCAGIFTGLAPGIHTNTVAALVLAGLAILTKWFSPLALGVLLVSMVIMHSFVDFIPSIFLGAPDDAETALSVLPGHRMLLEGKGYEALKLTVIGGVGATFIGLVMLPAFGFLVSRFYDKAGLIIPFTIIIFSIFFILMEKDAKGKIWALLVFLMSGVLGLLVLNDLPIKEPLFPLLTGLFGLPTIIISLQSKSKIVEQKISDGLDFGRHWFLHIKASFCAALMSVLPALGAAQATVLAQALSKKKSGSDFLVMVGGINTVSSIFVLTTLWLISRARTGVFAVMKQFLELDFEAFAVLLVFGIAALVFSVIVTLKLGKIIAVNITKIRYKKLSVAVLLALIALAGIFSGFFGLLVLSIATAIGLIAPSVGIKRIHAMGVLVIPVVTYFF